MGGKDKIERKRDRERQTDRQAQGREGGQVELGARKIYIGRRVGAQRHGRAWGHRLGGREGRGRVGRGGELTVQCS